MLLYLLNLTVRKRFITAYLGTNTIQEQGVGVFLSDDRD